MKKSVLISTLICAVGSASAFAHHPAADRVDPEIYAMIDENVSDTPHADLTFDDMGSHAEQLDAVVEAAAQRSEQANMERGEMARGEMAQGEMAQGEMAQGEMAQGEMTRSREMSGLTSANEIRALAAERAASAEMAHTADEMLDTIGLMDSVVNQLAE